MDDLDLRAVEAGQHRSGHNLVDRADHRRAGAEIENPVDRVDQRIQLMRAEQDRDLEIVADAAGDLDDALLMRRIERDQRLVEEQQARPAEQRLAQQHELALAAGKLRDRAPREFARPDFVERPVDLAADRLVEPGEAEARADRCAGDDVPPGEPQTQKAAAGLRHVADGGIAAGHRSPEDRDSARGDRNETERGAHQRRLAGPVGAQHADELAVLDREAGRREDVPAAEPDRRVVEA